MPRSEWHRELKWEIEKTIPKLTCLTLSKVLRPDFDTKTFQLLVWPSIISLEKNQRALHRALARDYRFQCMMKRKNKRHTGTWKKKCLEHNYGADDADWSFHGHKDDFIRSFMASDVLGDGEFVWPPDIKYETNWRNEVVRAMGRDLRLFAQLLKKRGSRPWDFDFIGIAVKNNHLREVILLRSPIASNGGDDKKQCPWHPNAIMHAVEDNNIDMLAILRSPLLADQYDGSRCPWHKMAVAKAALNGNLEMCKLLRSSHFADKTGRKAPWSELALISAVVRRNADIVRFFRSQSAAGIDRQKCPWSEFTFGIAFSLGLVEVVRALTSPASEDCYGHGCPHEGYMKVRDDGKIGPWVVFDVGTMIEQKMNLDLIEAVLSSNRVFFSWDWIIEAEWLIRDGGYSREKIVHSLGVLSRKRSDRFMCASDIFDSLALFERYDEITDLRSQWFLSTYGRKIDWSSSNLMLIAARRLDVKLLRILRSPECADPDGRLCPWARNMLMATVSRNQKSPRRDEFIRLLRSEELAGTHDGKCPWDDPVPKEDWKESKNTLLRAVCDFDFDLVRFLRSAEKDEDKMPWSSEMINALVGYSDFEEKGALAIKMLHFIRSEELADSDGTRCPYDEKSLEWAVGNDSTPPEAIEFMIKDGCSFTKQAVPIAIRSLRDNLKRDVIVRLLCTLTDKDGKGCPFDDGVLDLAVMGRFASCSAIECMIKHGCPFTKKALMLAGQYRRHDVVRLLCTITDKDGNHCPCDGFAFANVIAGDGPLELIKFVLKEVSGRSGPQWDDGALFTAIRDGRDDLVRFLRSREAACLSGGKRCPWSSEVLHRAVLKKNISIVRFLLSDEARGDDKPLRVRSDTLSFAIENNMADMVEVLVELGHARVVDDHLEKASRIVDILKRRRVCA